MTDSPKENFIGQLASNFMDIYQQGYDAGFKDATNNADIERLRSITSEDIKEIVKRTTKTIQ